jgi:hypothetical protein
MVRLSLKSFKEGSEMFPSHSNKEVIMTEEIKGDVLKIEDMEKNLAHGYKTLQERFTGLQQQIQATADEMRRIEGETRLVQLLKAGGLSSIPKPLPQAPAPEPVEKPKLVVIPGGQNVPPAK